MTAPDRQGEAEMPDDAFGQLVMRHLADDLDAESAQRLAATLAADAARRDEFVQLCFQAQLLRSRLRPLLEKEEAAAPPTRSVSEEDNRETDESSVTLRVSVPHIPHFSSHISRLAFHPITLLALAAVAVIGTLAYTFSSKRIDQPVASPNAESFEPAATLVRTTNAQWMGPFDLAKRAIKPGQRLVLERGSAEITFSSQARVVFEGPADFTIVDAMACRLSGGKLTAHVPGSAKGFTVHTPEGSVKDLGTEFGVLVKTENEDAVAEGEREQTALGSQQDGRRQPVTEVHVFAGKVQLTQSPTGATGVPPVQDGTGKMPVAPDSKSQTANQKSEILSAGQAVTISANKVQPLPAADPFQFALDKLAAQPRHVLLTEDFEAYDVGSQVKVIGPWIVQSGIRKGQGITVYDPRAKMAEMTNDAANPVANLSPAPAIGARVAYIAAGAQNPRDTFPLLAREIDGKVLTKNCQVLVEFDYMPLGYGIQFSLAFAEKIGHTTGIELWRDVDAAKKVAPPGYQWYRLRVLLDVADGVVREVRAERSHWLSSAGWVRDLTYQPPTPKLDWSTPPRYAMFGFPVVSPTTPAGVFLLDNVRIEVISE